MTQETRGAGSVVFMGILVGGLLWLWAGNSLAQEEEVAAAGKNVYNQNCAVCHGGNLISRDNDASTLSGPDFELNWHGKTVGQRFEQIRASMPLSAPGSLSDQEYLDILAYVFQYNGYPAGEQELKPDPETLKQIVIEPAPDRKEK